MISEALLPGDMMRPEGPALKPLRPLAMLGRVPLWAPFMSIRLYAFSFAIYKRPLHPQKIWCQSAHSDPASSKTFHGTARNLLQLLPVSARGSEKVRVEKEGEQEVEAVNATAGETQLLASSCFRRLR